MNHKKLLNDALRVGKGSMGMQGNTELFHPWARIRAIQWQIRKGGCATVQRSDKARHGHRTEKDTRGDCVSFSYQKGAWWTKNAHRQGKGLCSGSPRL